MCGIAGIWGDTQMEPVLEMMKAQRHRGPDGDGFRLLNDRGVMGHVRLSIMDPARGRQPMANEDESITLVANGMVYNHPRLRSELEPDHSFRSSSDSETLLHLFEVLRNQTPARLDGAFAFGVADHDRLFLARDPVGIKPLYYGYDDRDEGKSSIYFASELKALSPWIRDVQEFPAGSYFDSQSGIETYYRVPRLEPEDEPPEQFAFKLRQALEQAVEKRLLSDVPLGAFLSGGLDSSIIAAMAKRRMKELHTFSVGVEGSRDLVAARRVAQHIGSIHHEYAFTPDEILELLPEIVYYLESFDQDLVRSAVPCYICSRLAANHVKVILTGEGADELFAGYTYFKSIDDPARLHDEMRRSIEGLHNINLQRVDRMTMRHGIEGRVPFLDTEMIRLAQTIPPELKLRREGNGRSIEKWILRKAVEDLLPADIVWRDKEQFDEGSGAVDALDEVVRKATAGQDWAAYQKENKRDGLRSAEECYYHQVLMKNCPNPDVILRNVGRWAGAL